MKPPPPTQKKTKTFFMLLNNANDFDHGITHTKISLRYLGRVGPSVQDGSYRYLGILFYRNKDSMVVSLS